jgi:hypothetical protein
MQSRRVCLASLDTVLILCSSCSKNVPESQRGHYGRGRVSGFRGNPVREAWQTFATTIVWIVQIILQALAVLVPLGILLAIFIALWRTKPMRLFRGWLAGPREAEG